MRLLILFLALMVDRFVGDPDKLWRHLPHPVALFGALIAYCDRRFNREENTAETRRLSGRLCLVVLVVGVAAIGWILSCAFQWLGSAGVLAIVLETMIVSVILAQKSLLDHVQAVATALCKDGLAGGRQAVSMIVGRDPEALDRSGVCRAAIESLAENFSDGVVAPALWYLVGGLPGLMVYKLVNTADSMIGHRSDRHRDFGRGSAQLDDLMNWPAARISAGLIALGTAVPSGLETGKRALGTALRDAGLHRSPNAGWPEAAIAGALGLALGGPRSYGGTPVYAACLNGSGRRDAQIGDISLAIKIVSNGCGIGVAIVGFFAFLSIL